LFFRHTSVVVYGAEFFFGSMGIESCPPVRIAFFCKIIVACSNCQTVLFLSHCEQFIAI